MTLRANEAAGMRYEMIQTIHAYDRPLIFLADINDDLLSDTAKILLGEEPFWSFSEEESEAMWKVKLWSIYEQPICERPKHLTWSHVYKGRYSIIDLLAVSHHLLPSFDGKIGEAQSPKILLDHLQDLTGSVPLSKIDHAMISFLARYNNLPE